jgi:acetolactate synthase-1/2/3 large subunit
MEGDRLQKTKYTTASALMDALQEAGVSYIFSNLGSDHPAIIESWAQAKEKKRTLPQIILCPHEMVALSAAQGYAEATGQPQAVLVHVDCGTLNLGGAVHNVSKGRVPVLIFSGTSPITQEGEMIGSRNESIHWLQDVFDQRGSVREYMKYTNEIRTGKNVKQLVFRALQMAQSEPKGPVYLMASREVLEEEVEPKSLDLRGWQPIAPSALPPDQVSEIAEQLLHAQKPLIVTSYLGRNRQAINELIRLAERLAIPVLEASPKYVNFPASHAMHVGYVWHQQEQNNILSEADFILVLDSDVPWIPLVNKPSETCKVYYIDVDPLKERTPLWYIPSHGFFRADTHIALKQLNDYLDQHSPVNDDEISQRKNIIAKIHYELREDWKLKEQNRGDHISAEWLTACIRQAIGEDSIVINETVTYFDVVSKHLPRNKPGTLFTSGASALGWSGGGALGMKLAHPEQLVVSLVGDGTYMLSQPTTVYWMSRKYNLPILTVIYNNEGWRGPKLSTLGVHPNGVAYHTNQFPVDFSPSAHLADVAKAAGNAYAKTIEDPNELLEELHKAVRIVRNGQSAVLDVRLPNVLMQVV